MLPIENVAEPIVITDGGVVHADWVVGAASLPPKMFAPLRRHFRSMETYCVLTDSLPSFVRREFGRSRAITQACFLHFPARREPVYLKMRHA